MHVWFKMAKITHALPVPVYRQTETGGRFVFTLNRREISYRSEILAPAQEPRWTHAGVTRASMTFCGGIMETNIEPWQGTGVNSLRGERRTDVM